MMSMVKTFTTRVQDGCSCISWLQHIVAGNPTYRENAYFTHKSLVNALFESRSHFCGTTKHETKKMPTSVSY